MKKKFFNLILIFYELTSSLEYDSLYHMKRDFRNKILFKSTLILLAFIKSSPFLKIAKIYSEC